MTKTNLQHVVKIIISYLYSLSSKFSGLSMIIVNCQQHHAICSECYCVCKWKVASSCSNTMFVYYFSGSLATFYCVNSDKQITHRVEPNVFMHLYENAFANASVDSSVYTCVCECYITLINNQSTVPADHFPTPLQCFRFVITPDL